METPRFALGLDFGTSSARALIVDIDSGEEIGSGTANFAHGEAGIVVCAHDPHCARQVPGDWRDAAENAVRDAVARGLDTTPGFRSQLIVGIGIDATASTPLPVDARCRPLADDERFRNRPDAMAWLWKDHTAHVEAAEITALARRELPHHLARCGGAYSSEWLFAKLLCCLRVAPDVVDAASAWIESGDWIVAFLCGLDDPRLVPRNACAAGHKGLFHDELGPPPRTFLDALDPRLGAWCETRVPARTTLAGERAGGLCAEWAAKLGLRVGTPVSVAAIDAHVGAVGAGIRPGRLVSILGTSACDMIVHPLGAPPIAEISGLCGMVRGSILPDCWGLEAGQSAVGDLFGWFVREFGKSSGLGHAELTAQATRLAPGESGLLALDWNNGNRSVLADPLLSGCVVGTTLRTTAAEIYRTLIEATAFGARVIVERIEESGVAVDDIVLCGGIAPRNPLLRSIYADVLRRPLHRSRSTETCALGAAIFGAVAAGAHPNVASAQNAMTALDDRPQLYDGGAADVYDELHALYLRLHDAFGGVTRAADLSPVMKDLLHLKTRTAVRIKP